MQNFKFEKLLKKDKTQLFIISCPGNLPFSFASHMWFVINKKGKLSRWELLFRKNRSNHSWGHLHKDFMSPFHGLSVLPYLERYVYWNSKLIFVTDKEKYSKIDKVIAEIEDSYKNYPYLYEYSLIKPNSNTYIKWVLKKFPDLNIRLPVLALG